MEYRPAGERMLTVSDARWPIVDIDYGETITFDEIDRLGERLEQILQARGPMALIVDITALRVAKVTALHRKKVADEADKLAAAGGFIAEAVVIRNPVGRALFIGYSWVRKPPTHPVETFKDSALALVWAKERVRAAARK